MARYAPDAAVIFVLTERVAPAVTTIGIEGKQTAFVASSRTTGKSLALVVSNVSSHVCFSSKLSINHVHSHFCPNYRPLVLDAFALSTYKLKFLVGMYPQRKLQICP